MKTSRVISFLGVLVTIGELLTFVALGISLYTAGMSVGRTFERGPEGMRITGDIDPDTGEFQGSMGLTVRNAGMLEISVVMTIRIISRTGSVLYTAADEARVQVGSFSDLEMQISLPGYAAQQVDRVDLELEVRTLFDLILFSLAIPVPIGYGEAPLPGG